MLKKYDASTEIIARGGGECHDEVAKVECHRYHSALGDAHTEDFGEGLYHGTGHVIGKTPQREARGNHYKRQHQVCAILHQES